MQNGNLPASCTLNQLTVFIKMTYFCEKNVSYYVSGPFWAVYLGRDVNLQTTTYWDNTQLAWQSEATRRSLQTD